MSQEFSDIRIDSPAPEVAHADADKYWQWLWPALELGGVDYTPGELADELLRGDVLLIRIWRGEDIVGVAAARVRSQFDVRELFIMGLVGEDSEEWIEPLSATFDQLAVEADCDAIALEGRPGWSRKLRGLGYSLHQITMRKPLEGKGNGQSRLQ